MNSRGLIEAAQRYTTPPWRAGISAVNSRGLIEAVSADTGIRTSPRISAVNSRGLIEAFGLACNTARIARFPR